MKHITLPNGWGIYESKINDFHSRFIIFNQHGHNKAEFFTDNPQDINMVRGFADDMNCHNVSNLKEQLRVAVEALEKITRSGTMEGAIYDPYGNLLSYGPIAREKARVALEQIKGK